MTDAGSFYSGQDFWQVPDDPTQEQAAVVQPPYYLTLRCPARTTPKFSLTSTFMPTGDARRCSPASSPSTPTPAPTDGKRRQDYGKLRLLELPQGQRR